MKNRLQASCGRGDARGDLADEALRHQSFVSITGVAEDFHEG